MPKSMSPFFHHLETPDGFSGELTSLSIPPKIDDLADRAGFLMISIKNRLFSSPLINAYCCFATEYLRSGYITVVDRPYIRNVEATSNDHSSSARQMNTIRRLGEERERQVHKIVKKYDRDRIKFLSWDDLSIQTPKWLQCEVHAAFRNKRQFYLDLLQQTQRSIGSLFDRSVLERYALFLVEETPVLLYSYYSFCGGIVDFYPGDIADYFWRIERGDYADELPRTTEMTAAHQGLIYVNILETRSMPQKMEGDSRSAVRVERASNAD
jgi:hypothetical protein